VAPSGDAPNRRKKGVWRKSEESTGSTGRNVGKSAGKNCAQSDSLKRKKGRILRRASAPRSRVKKGRPTSCRRSAGRRGRKITERGSGSRPQHRKNIGREPHIEEEDGGINGQRKKRNERRTYANRLGRMVKGDIVNK